MDLNTIGEIARPDARDAIDWREGDAWLAGGTWLFSEPQPHLLPNGGYDAQGWLIRIGCAVSEIRCQQPPEVPREPGPIAGPGSETPPDQSAKEVSQRERCQ